MATPRPGVALILPFMERSIDPHGLYQVDYQCMRRAIETAGYAVQIVDPRNPQALHDALVSETLPFILTARSQSECWPLPSAETFDGERARGKILITLVGNPPYYGASVQFHQSEFRRKLAMCADHDTLGYAKAINTSGARLLPYRPAFHDASLDDQASRRPNSRRDIPIMFAATYQDPEAYRQLWRSTFAKHPKAIRAIEGAAETLSADLSLPVISALSESLKSLDVGHDLRNETGMTVLRHLNRFVHFSARQKIIKSVLQRPSVVIATELPPRAKIHPKCTVRRGESFAKILRQLHRVRCVVAQNPNWMTGAISERVSNAMRRGAVVLNAPNNALRKYDGSGVVLFGNRYEGLEEWMDLAVAGDPRLDEIGTQAREIAETEFRMDRAFAAVLATASDPAFWEQ